MVDSVLVSHTAFLGGCIYDARYSRLAAWKVTLKKASILKHFVIRFPLKLFDCDHSQSPKTFTVQQFRQLFIRFIQNEFELLVVFVSAPPFPEQPPGMCDDSGGTGSSSSAAAAAATPWAVSNNGANHHTDPSSSSTSSGLIPPTFLSQLQQPPTGVIPDHHRVSRNRVETRLCLS